MNNKNNELSYIFEKQKQFQSVTLGKDISNLTIEERSKLVHEHMHFLIEESIEALRPLPYHKEWKDYSEWTEMDVKEAFEESQEEALDVFIFLINAMFLLGIESDDISQMYKDKLEINKERQHNPDLGYVNHSKAETPESQMDSKRYTKEERDTLGKSMNTNIPKNLYVNERSLITDLKNVNTKDFFDLCYTNYYPGFLKVKLAVMITQKGQVVNYVNDYGVNSIFLADDFIVESNDDVTKKELNHNITSLLLENTLNNEEELSSIAYDSPCVITNVDDDEIYIIFNVDVSEVNLKLNNNFRDDSFNTLKQFSKERDWDFISFSFISKYIFDNQTNEFLFENK